MNLSNKKLNLCELSILNKGLNFCISETNKDKIATKMKSEIKHFIRNLQIKQMFEDKNNTNREPFTGNPGWKPPRTKCHQALTALTDILEEDIDKLIHKNKLKRNISQIERKTILNLRNDKNIIIKRADKGGCIVVMDTQSYLSKMNTMLSDTTTYTTTTVDINNAKKQVDNIITKLLNIKLISDKQCSYLQRNTPKLPSIYGLPKIHKPNCPLRPIVSQINSPSYKLNKYLDYLLTTAEKCIPYLLPDTTKYLQYINALPIFTEHKPLLFSLDVTSLYTVLPHNMCIEYVNEMYLETLSHWDTYTPDIKPIPSSMLKEIIKIILDQTFFEFNDITFKQNYGITMGAPSSVKIANITLYKHLEKIQSLFLGIQPHHCFRLIDDIMGVWLGPLDELLIWYNYLNDNHPTIKFTIEHSERELPFLDTLTYIDNNKIKTKLYKKPTNKKQYLSYNSEHPAHMKKSIPYAQALRYRRIIEDDTILDQELETLQNNFTSRGYPLKTTNDQIKKARHLNRQTTITYKIKSTTEINFTPLVLTFSNIFNNNAKNTVYKTVSRIWSELTSMAPILQKIKDPKIVFKKCNTISNSLECSKFPPKWWGNSTTLSKQTTSPLLNQITPNTCSTYYSRPCNTQKCGNCTHIKRTNRFYSTTYNKTFKISNNFNCSSSNLIYLITCSLCKIQYVGETGNSLRNRSNRHRSNIKLKQNTAIGIHFNTKNHTLKHFTITPIEQIIDDGKIQRLNREYYWQLRLGTVFPKGLNNYPVNYDNLSLSPSPYTTLDLQNVNFLQALLDENEN